MELIYKVSFFLTLFAIEYLATTSHTIESIANIWDKAKHSFAFFVLYILLSFAFKNLTTLQKAFILILYGIQIEIIQYFLPYREFSLLDVFADSVGIALGVVLIFLVKKFWTTKHLTD